MNKCYSRFHLGPVVWQLAKGYAKYRKVLSIIRSTYLLFSHLNLSDETSLSFSQSARQNAWTCLRHSFLPPQQDPGLAINYGVPAIPGSCRSATGSHKSMMMYFPSHLTITIRVPPFDDARLPGRVHKLLLDVLCHSFYPIQVCFLSNRRQSFVDGDDGKRACALDGSLVAS